MSEEAVRNVAGKLGFDWNTARFVPSELYIPKIWYSRRCDKQWHAKNSV